MARAASSTKQQMTAYVQAVDSLSERFERLEYCVELAEWMIQTGLSKKDSNDVLTAAADAFLDVEEGGLSEELNGMDSGGEEEEEGGEGGDSRSVSQRSVAMSRNGGSRSGNISRAGTASGSAVGGGRPGTGSHAKLPIARSSSRTSMRSVKTSMSGRSSAGGSVGGGGGGKAVDGGVPETLNIYHMSLFMKTLVMIAKSADGYR